LEKALKALSAEQKILDQRLNQSMNEQRNFRLFITIGLVISIIFDGLAYFFDTLKNWMGE
jgi:hypothetical protein